MKVLVTGIDGYIGSILSSELIKAGFDITGLDTGFYRAGWLYNESSVTPRVLTKDIRNVTVEDLKDFDAIIHMAELSNDPLGQNNPELTFNINHKGSLALAEKAKEAGVKRFIYTSSCSVYGVGSGDDFMNENSPTNPQTAYAECKTLVERDVTKLASDSFSPTFLRNATVYGASPRMRFDIVLNNLAGLAWTTHEIKMVSDGTPWRPLVHVKDVCKAIICVLNAPKEAIHNQIFNVGSNEQNYRVRQIAEIVASVFTGCTTTFGTSNPDNRSYRVSFDKISTQLPGFSCERDAKKGAKELYEVFNRIGLTKEMFEYRAYTRLKQLQYLIDTKQLDEKLLWK